NKTKQNDRVKITHIPRVGSIRRRFKEHVKHCESSKKCASAPADVAAGAGDKEQKKNRNKKANERTSGEKTTPATS
uniref:Uncharacterized protein n=1 Tax=Anopheles atroparvus TaxID=41427 RepID=A0AAG5CP66_ANOAO